jgi:hypothetical protein
MQMYKSDKNMYKKLLQNNFSEGTEVPQINVIWY